MTTTSDSNNGLDAKEKTGEAALGDALVTCWEDLFSGEPIASYSRAQMVDDGEMVAIDFKKSRPFFLIPVGITRTVWDSIVAFDTASDATFDMRLASLLSCAEHAARRAKGDDLTSFTYSTRGDAPKEELLFLHVGPGDTAAPVVTIMLPQEL